MIINIINHQKKIDFSAALTAKIKKAARYVLSSEKINKKCVITICFVTNRIIKQLNKKHLGKNSPTDVIAFNMPPIEKGDCFNAQIAISTDTVISNAKIYKTTVMYELFLYVVHGILHTVGYNDRTKKQRERMHKKEINILKSVKCVRKNSHCF